jgi:hypothetical protein
MTGMKITVDAAMRARDVSRPTPDQEAAAASAELAQVSGRGPGGRLRRAQAPDRRRAKDQAAGTATAGPGRTGAAGPLSSETGAPAEADARTQAQGQARVRRRSRPGRPDVRDFRADGPVASTGTDQGTGGSVPDSS